MKKLLGELEKRKIYLEKVLNYVEGALTKVPHGNLRVSKMQGRPRYYHMTEVGDTKGKYIKKKDVELAKRLAQKDYLLQLRQRVQAEWNMLDKYIEMYKKESVESVYYELNIPYRYEAELRLRNGKIKFPDFTLLNVNTREVIYHEHLGLLDDAEYRRTNLIKLNEYQKNGIYLGKNLIVTYEAEGVYLNILELKQICKELFT